MLPLGFMLTFLLQVPGESPVDFQKDIRPLLSDRCFTCHGPDDSLRDSDLRLDSAGEALRDLGGYHAIVPRDPEASELILRITEADPDNRMPPADSGRTLTGEEIELLTRWVEQGADFTPHWAFVSPEDPTPPTVNNRSWIRDPLDQFILNRLEEARLDPTPQTDRLTWLRRVHFVLTGLPPTSEEIRNFGADLDEGAYDRAVDRLLNSTHFGERMAQPWLDLARYADTHGYQSDVGRRVWPYRDWVIAAYNRNLPYDDFIRWQLAGDLLPGPTAEHLTATAFNRLHRQTNEGGSVEEEFRVEYVSDRVHTFGTAFLGLTLECARCHDHRYDPISQKEYYELASYFDNIDESGLYSHFTSATPTPTVDLPTPEQSLALESASREVERLELSLAEEPTQLKQLIHDQIRGVEPAAVFTFDEREDLPTVESPRKRAVVLDGDTGVRFPEAGQWQRSDPFGVSILLKVDRTHERAVVLHRSRAWTDAGSQGWQILIEDGRVQFSLVHFWPGNAIAIRSQKSLPLNEWVRVMALSDGSSQANGLALFFDGEEQPCDTVRDHLTRSITGGDPGPPTLGQRFRDRGFAGGHVDEVSFFNHTDPNQGLTEARLKRDQTRDAIAQLMVMREMSGPRQTYRLERGSYEERREAVSPDVPAIFRSGPTPTGQSGKQPDRDDLASWLLKDDHPLTARVEVDRLWRAVFGRGLVATPENFGSQGTPPTHPLLLDYLARQFQRSDWDRKALLKRLVLSSTFRQSSAADANTLAADPENTLWSRGPSFSLPAEMLRDNALAGSGLLVKKLGGPSVFPYQPDGLWREKSGHTYQPSQGDGLYRRSLYTYWKRTSPPPTMMIFDAAKRDVCVARRSSTNTPLQALALWNDPQFGEAARVLAADLCQAEDPIDDVFLRLAARPPRPDERKALEELFRSELEAFQSDPARAEAVRSVGEWPVPADLSPPEHAAWTLVCSALLASDPVVMLR